jgi:hypothetical protein
MATFAEYKFWSVILGCDAVRISMVDDHGSEFFKVVPIDNSTKKYRDVRERVLEMIQDAIDRGDDPGEVVGDWESYYGEDAETWE